MASWKKRKQLKLLEIEYEKAQSLDSTLSTDTIVREMSEIRIGLKDPKCSTCRGKGWHHIEPYVGRIKDIVTCRTCKGTGRVDRKGPGRKK